MNTRFLAAASMALGLASAACQSFPVDTASAFARSAGESTVMVGSTCNRPLAKGFDSCQLERGKPLPKLTLMMMNPGEWALSDCRLNIWRQGAVDHPQLVEVDLTELTRQVEEDGFCLLKLETLERFPDPRDGSQWHTIPISGGFFIEVLAPGYNPVPSPDVINWCFAVGRTTKGRTVMKSINRDHCK